MREENFDAFLAPLTLYSRSPAEYYIKYVLTHDLHANLEDLTPRLEAFDLMLPAGALVYVRRLAEDLEQRMPSPFVPNDASNIPSQYFLHQQGVWGMWHPDQALRDAQSIQNDPVLREKVRGLLTAGVHYRDLVAALNQKGTLTATDRTLDYYKHYFWNLELLTIDERESLFQDYRVPTAVRSASRSRTSGGRAKALKDYGHEPRSVDKRQGFEELFSAGHGGLEAATMIPDPLERMQAVVQSGQAMIMGHRGLLELQQQQKDAIDGLPVAETVRTKRLERTSFTMKELLEKGKTPPLLPGRSLTLVDAEYKEVNSGSKAG
jgi:hypothetical protein